MARTIRFHLDEHVAHAVADGLQKLGIDVTTTTDASLLGADDADQIAYGLTQGRVIFTEDDGFLNVLAPRRPSAQLLNDNRNVRS
jgi:predicted nuclease of predicted toxin-antitoxin system